MRIASTGRDDQFMNHRCFAQTGAAVLLALSMQAAVLPAHAQTAGGFMLTSLEWPPYSGQNLPQQGVSSAVVSAAMSGMGEHVTISFYPWNRATALVRAE